MAAFGVAVTVRSVRSAMAAIVGVRPVHDTGPEVRGPRFKIAGTRRDLAFIEDIGTAMQFANGREQGRLADVVPADDERGGFVEIESGELEARP